MIPNLPFYYAMQIYTGSSFGSTVAGAWRDFPANDKAPGEQVALLYDEDTNLVQGLYAKRVDRWIFAIPYLDMCESIIRGDKISVYVDPVGPLTAPAGSTLYRNGFKQTGLDITPGANIWAARTPPSSGGGGGAVDSVNGQTGTVVLTAADITGFGAVAYSNNYNDLTNKPAPYALPMASASVLGGIKVGTGLAIDVNGVLSAPAATITLNGDVSGTSSAGVITAVLSNSGVVAGTYTKVTVDSKGRVTVGAALAAGDVTGALGYTPYNGATNPLGFLTSNQTITASGDVSGSGTTALTLTLAAVGTAGTYKSVTVDAKGRVTAGTNPTTLAGYGIVDALSNTGGNVSGNITFTGGATLTGVPNPVNPLDAVNKQSLDNAIAALVTGTNWKANAQVATIANITLSGLQTIDGYAVQALDRVLVKVQTNPAENGVYVAGSGAWTRATDVDTGAEIKGMAILVLGGSTNTLTQWVNTNTTTPTVGTDPITYSMLQGAGTTYTAGTGLTLTGNTFSISNTGVSTGTYSKVTVNAQGQVTAGAALNATDVNSALGYTAYNGATNPSGFLTANQAITLSGDVSGSGTTAITVALTNSGVSAGTYKSVTVDAKGRVTAGTNPTTLAGYGITDAASVAQIAARSGASTSIFNGGVVSINADPTKFDVSAGNAQFVDYTDPQNPVSTTLAFGPFSAVIVTNIDTQIATYVGLTQAGSLVQQATPFTATQRRTIAHLGLLIHSNLTNINVVNQTTPLNRSMLNQLQDLFEAIGPLNVSGNVFSANGANLNLNKSAGVLLRYGSNAANSVLDPHQVSLPQTTALTFRYRQANGTESADRTTVNPAQWDNAGTLTAVGGTQFTIQRIYVFQAGAVRIQYGQAVYASLAAALDAINTEAFVTESNIAANGVARALLIVRGNVTDLTNTAQAQFIEVPKFGLASAPGGAAVTSSDIIAALGYTPVSKAGDTMTGVLDWNTTVTIASAATTDIGAAASNSIIVSGSATITALGSETAGALRLVTFSGTPTLTYNATTLILPTAANIVAAAGDAALFVSLGGNNWRCVNYMRANGSALSGSPDATKLPLTGGTLSGALNLAPLVSVGSGATTSIGAAAANSVTITGTTTITAFDTIAAGAVRSLIFAGALTLTHNATSLILPTGANITTAAGDVAEFLSLGAGNWRCVSYQRANGLALAATSDATKLSLTGGTMSGALNNAPAVSVGSGATTSIGAAASNDVTVTGTSTITAFDTIASGAHRTVTFAASLTLTHNATSLILPTAANIVTAAGDVAEFVSLGGGNWRCEYYTRASGAALVGSPDATKLPLAGGTLSGTLNNAPAVTIASAASVSIGAAAANDITLTGTATITTFDVIAAGAHRTLTFSGIMTLTHNATSLILPGAANITTAVGDVAEFVSLGAGNWRCEYYSRANGSALSGSPDATKLPLAGGTMSGAINNAPAVTIAAAASTAIGAAAANDVTITGSTTITSFDTIAAGAHRTLTFAAALTLTHNGTSLILPGAANIVTAAGDVAEFVSLGSGNWRCEYYTKANGQAVVVSSDATKLSLSGGTMSGALNVAPAVTIASAATVAIGAAAANDITISGTTTITAFDTIAASAHRVVTFSGILTLTHNASSLILPGAANITTAVGDVAEFVSLGGGNWKCVDYQRANGTAISGNSTNASLTNPTVTNYVEAGNTAAAGTAFTIDLTTGTDQDVTTNGNATITMPAVAVGKSFTLTVNYGGTHTVTFAGGTIRWAGGVAPAATSTSGKADRYVFQANRAGTAWFGADAGRNY
jgi:hypothetical protein